ncbi:MAG: hypothetical protein QM767_29315 [Anaeromyxobacter sp.]
MKLSALAVLAACTLLPGLAAAQFDPNQPVPAQPAAPLPPPPPGRQLAPPPAPPPVQPWAFVASCGFDLGSTTIVQVYMDDGTKQKLKANEGFFLSAGAAFLRAPVKEALFDTVATIGFKGWTVGGDNADFHSYAFPLEVMERVQLRWFRAGAGFTYQMGGKINGRGDFDAYDVSLENSLGFLGEVGWVSSPSMTGGRWNVGMRVLAQDLTDEATGVSVDASTVGFVLGWQSN